ncbi:hypothetical protein BV25DRAFT_1421517 [Artomyces pyxidatus]|uniref:Uncharacterized protein n=1 Tax=Artomyces pyxidatus TaxID=48021 RepID=A0ACB8TE98_9AGAM|nr:hypothetical protein BV25DRAFT_1421517 [Artomyces pyxidatus]
MKTAHVAREAYSSALLGGTFSPSKPCFISRVPVEVLERILYWIPAVASDPRERNPSAFMHVCGHWREVALGSKDCWTVLPMCSIAWTLFALEQSRPLPITIRASSYAKKTRVDGALKLALGGFSRVRELFLDTHLGGETFPFNAEYVLCMLEVRSAPFLEAVSIEVLELHAMEFSGFLPIQTQKPRAVYLRNVAPRSLTSGYLNLSLTTLEIYGRWNDNVATDTTYVTLSWLHAGIQEFGLGTSLWPTWDKFRECLGSLTSLESLVIVGHLLPQRDYSFPDQPVAVLPHLQNLRVHDAMDSIAVMMQCQVSFPSHANVCIRTRWHGWDNGELLAHTLDAYLASLKDYVPSFKHMTIASTASTSDTDGSMDLILVDTSVKPGVVYRFEIEQFRPPEGPPDDEQRAFPHRKQRTCFEIEASDCHVVALRMLQRAKCLHDSLRKLTIDVDFLVMTVMTRHMTPFMRNIRELDVRNMYGLADLMTAVRRMEEPALFPHLVTLQLPPASVSMECVIPLRDLVEARLGRRIFERNKDLLQTLLLVEFGSLVGAKDVRSAPEPVRISSDAFLGPCSED